VTIGGIQERRRRDIYVAGLWRMVGDFVVDGQSNIEAGLDQLERKVDVLTMDVGAFKTDLTETKERLDRLEGKVDGLTVDMADVQKRLRRIEWSTENRIDKVDGQVNVLTALVESMRTKPS
jgi:tetrahydromethanopterin S-methyltransferase subunit G